MNMDYRKNSAKADKEHRGEWVESDDEYRSEVEAKKRSKGEWIEDSAEYKKKVLAAKRQRRARQKQKRIHNVSSLPS